MKNEVRFVIDGQKLIRTENNVIAESAAYIPEFYIDVMPDVWSECNGFYAEFKNGSKTIKQVLDSEN